MKNILSALLWAASFMPVFAQKTLPVSLQAQMTNCDIAATAMLERAGFELTACPAGTSISVRQRSNTLQLDSTKTFHAYGLNAPSDSTPLFRTIYQYPQPNVKIESEAQYENDTWLTLNRLTTRSDAQGRVLEVFGEAFEPADEAFVPDSRLEAFPHGNSPTLLDSFFVYQWDLSVSEWRLLMFSKNVFDDQDRLVESISSFDYFGTALIFKDRHTYDANGDNTLIESVALIDGAEFPAGRRELSYKNSRLTQVIAYIPDETGQDLPQDKTTYTYTSFGKERQVNKYTWSLDANDWVHIQVNTYAYDGMQRLIAQESILYNEDSSEERELINFTYLEDDNLNFEERFFWDGTDYQLIDRKFYYYGNGTLGTEKPAQGALPLVISPNPTVGEVRLNLDAAIWVRVYDTSGQLVNSEQPTGNTLDLAALPSGLYFVTALTADALYSGRLVKE